MEAKAQFLHFFCTFFVVLAVPSSIPSQDSKEECGKQLIRSGRIVGGEDAFDGEFPYMVSIRLGGGLFGQHHCGAVIVRKQWVLTAGHCVNSYAKKHYTVRVGEYDVTKKESDHTPQDLQVESIVLHPDLFRPKRYNNDIALLKLKRPISYDSYSWPACLPNPDDDFTGKNGTVTGWGLTKEPGDGGRRATILQKLQVPVMNNSLCQEIYNEAQRRVKFHEGQICAGFREGQKDSCQGDSGGPLVVKENNRFTVIGVVSAGIGCARPLLPGVYSLVSRYVPWIEETMDSS